MRWAALLLALSQLATPPIIMRVYGEFLSTGATNDAVITPARYAFSIWGLITCSRRHLRRRSAPRAGRTVGDSPARGLSVVFVGFTGWLLIAAQNWFGSASRCSR